MKTKRQAINNWHMMVILILLIVSGTNAQNCDSNKLIFNQNFNQYNAQNKLYTRSLANNDFPRLGGRTSGGNVRGLSNDFPQRNRVINGELRAEFTKNDASGRSGGFIFDSSFDGVEEATLEYRVKFASNFIWATGGKLPGLGGASTPNGAQPAGCTQNQNTINNAFSARLMWRSNRAHTQPPYLIVYDYLPNRETRCGGNTRLGNLKLERNKWYTVKQYLKLNSPGQRNGVLKMYIDGQELVDLDNVMFRLSGKGSVKINSIVMHTYRGGNRTDPVWHSPQDDYAYFDDFKVWTNCSGDTGGNENIPPSISFANPSGNTSVQEGYNNLKVTINASDSDGSIANVKLYVDGNLIRQENQTPFEWGQGSNANELVGLSVGQHTIKAEATDNEGAKSSKAFTLTVNSATNNQTPLVSFDSPSNDLTVEEGYDLTVKVNASDLDGTVSNVKLFINNDLVRQENVTPYEWGHNNSPNPNEVNGLSVGNYTFKAIATDNDGGTSETTFTLIVKDQDNGSNGCSFEMPSSIGISAMDKVTYTNVHVIGSGGPLLSNFRKFTINWVPDNNGLYQFAINTNNGSPDWYVDFKDTISFQLQNSQPEVTLSNTGFAGLDGSYWVTRDGDNFVMVSKDQEYTLYFSNSTQAPICANRVSKISISKNNLQNIKLFPNPVKSDILTIDGLENQKVTLQVFSLIGRRVLIKKIKGVNVCQLPVGSIESGSYVLSIKGSSINTSLHFIKK